MSYLRTLPERYWPLHTLDLCSNLFIDVSMPMAIREFPILLIAGGLVPTVWLSAPRFLGSSEWRFVVEEGRSTNPAIQVMIDRSRRETIIAAGSTRLIRAAMTADDEAQVTELDLRPVGVNVTGTESDLLIGPNRFVGNRFQNVKIGIALG